MPRDYAAEPRAKVRRHDRAVDDEGWIRAMLHRAPAGALATVHDGQPFINTNLFVYDEAAHRIYFHTARVGRTQANVAAGSPVCFSVFEMGRLLPADTAVAFSVEYAGVTVFGAAEIVQGDEARQALQLMLDKYAPHLRPDEHYQPTTAADLARTAVFRIDIETWSGKRKTVPDHPGAFVYPLTVEG